MKSALWRIMIMAMVSISLNGCRHPPAPPDTDVTASPEYNFAAFAGTVWKTKVKVALADITRSSGLHHTALLAPEDFDPTHPEYRPPFDMQVISVLPVGIRLRIERLMEDNGPWSGVWVTASLEDGEVVYLSDFLLAHNRFISPGWSDSKDWGVKPDMLEKAPEKGPP